MTRLRPLTICVAVLSVAIAGTLVLSAGTTSNFPAARRPTAARSPGKTGAQSLPQRFYGKYANGLPTSLSWFPIGVFGQSPAGGDVPGHRNQAQAFKAMGINVFIGSGAAWPTSYGRDTYGEFEGHLRRPHVLHRQLRGRNGRAGSGQFG